MSRITELIDCVKIYNLCNHCDHFKCGECSVDNVNCKEEIEKQIISEIRADAIKEYHDKLSKEMHDLWRFYKADTNNRPKPDFMCAYSMVDLIAEQLKKEHNNDK